MKLSNKHRKALESALHHLERAEKFLKRQDVVGIAIKTDYPNGASYSIGNKECSANKRYVSKHLSLIHAYIT